MPIDTCKIFEMVPLMITFVVPGNLEQKKRQSDHSQSVPSRRKAGLGLSFQLPSGRPAMTHSSEENTSVTSDSLNSGIHPPSTLESVDILIR